VPDLNIALYEDGRPPARYRLNARDQGVILRHGGRWDIYGARDVWVHKSADTFFLHYDAEGPQGWLTALATSRDLTTFARKGPLLAPGPAGAPDSAGACYGTTYFDGRIWRMFYLGTQNASPPPERVPLGPYVTLEAKAARAGGPWTKEPGVVLAPKKGTYYSDTASPGFIVKSGPEYLQFFSAGMRKAIGIARTIGIARASDLDGRWTVDERPILPLEEQIENTSLYFQRSTRTWFMFTNHIALRNHKEFADAVWVYWTQDLRHWNADHKAVVLDGSNSTWSKTVIGLPSVLPVNGRLAIFYDGLEARLERAGATAERPDAYEHMFRDIGLAWLDLPIRLPPENGAVTERRNNPRQP